MNQHRARDVAHLLVFAMAVAFVFTLIAALNDAAPRRADRAIGGAQVEAGSAVEVAAPASRALFLAPPPERDAVAENDHDLRDRRPKRP